MKPVVTPEEMRAIDAAAPEPVEELIERAGWAVARSALSMLGGSYGRRVLIVAGKGNNGADGVSAARYLTRRGVRCTVITPAEATSSTEPVTAADTDLVIDAAYGTGFRGSYAAPAIAGVQVLAVDIPSGVDGLTGSVGGSVLSADATIAFAAHKPGLLFEPGRSLAGEVTVVDIGIDCSSAQAWLLRLDDLAVRWPRVEPTTHKWKRAVWVIGGSPGLDGAPGLAAAAAARGGASCVAVSIPAPEAGAAGVVPNAPSVPIEAIRPALGAHWSADVLSDHDRFAALVIGPGLAVDESTAAEVRRVVANRNRPLVLDAGAIDALAADPSVVTQRGHAEAPVVLTPHDGEFARLTGAPPGPDRIAAARKAAANIGAVVALKGPTTVVADPGGRVLISSAGDQRLATAGTGDVLAGLIGAGLAGGLDPLTAAGLGAELHGRASFAGFERGFMAADLPPLVARFLATL